MWDQGVSPHLGDTFGNPVFVWGVSLWETLFVYPEFWNSMSHSHVVPALGRVASVLNPVLMTRVSEPWSAFEQKRLGADVPDRPCKSGCKIHLDA